MRIQASGAITGTAIDTLTEAEVAFLDSVAAADGAAEISGGLMAIATGEDTADQAQTASSVWRVYAGGADGAGGAGGAGDAGGAGRSR
jgi:mycothiol synthase